MSDIALHIERLVLEGIALGGRGPRGLQAAVELELARLLSQRGLAAPLLAGGALPGISAPAMQLHGGESPAVLGRQIAGAVYREIGR